MNDTFRKNLSEFLIKAINNAYFDNHVLFYRHGDYAGILALIEQYEREKNIPASKKLSLLKEKIEHEIENKSYLYGILSDKKSRDTLVMVAAYSILGPLHVKFPYYDASSLLIRENIFNKYRALSEENNAITQKYPEIHLFNISIANHDVSFYGEKEFLYSHLTEKADYTCTTEDTPLRVEKGDIVLDCGACHGDTALFFALAAGSEGKVISFEPNPDNILLFKENMRLNPSLAKQMSLIEHATWHTDNTTLRFSLSGPGSTVMESNNGTTAPEDMQNKISITTITVDTVVNEHILENVHFIKMDVEGAELNTLRGAKRTLEKFKPKIAVCLYHNPQEDYRAIPAFLASLNLEYEFFLRHHYMNEWETVLYARVKQN